MKVLSLFSGVGGFDLGLEQAGMETVFQCEYDKQCLTVLEKHWPQVPRWTDVTTLTGKHILEHAPVIDVIAWGSPCQDLSVAGKRAGLDGTKSSLFYEGMRVISELRKATDNVYPRISIWENVAGALSSNKGNDFGAVIDSMAEQGALVIDWAVLDAQGFGIPQRRRRVFCISVFDTAIADRCTEEVLPVGYSVHGDTQTSRAQGQSITTTTDAGSEQSFDWHVEIEPVGALQSHLATYGSADDAANGLLLPVREPEIIFENSYRDGVRLAEQGITQTLTAKMGTGGLNTPMLAYSIREDAQADNFSATEVETVRSLSAHQPSVQSHHAQTFIAEPMAIRRLLPIECERLMGWGDDWTRYRADGTEQADTHRYKQIGNGVASPVARWVAEQILRLM